MFQTGRQRPRADAGTLLAIAAVAAALVALQSGALVMIVGRPLERALVAAREPPRATILVRVPEYVEELEVVGPPRWERELARLEASRRTAPAWLADRVAAPVPLVCPASER